MRMPRALQVAILIWKRGDLIPLDIETELMALGFDVRILENQYRA